MKKTFVNLLCALVTLCFMGMFCSCSDEKDEAVPDGGTTDGDSISVSVSTMDFKSYGGTQTVSVTATGSWTVECPYWMSASPSSGTGNAKVTVTAESNSYSGAKSRSGSLKFTLDSDGSSAYILVSQFYNDGVIKILAIGNSLTEDSVEQYLWELFDAAGMEAIVANMYIGACDLETHYRNAVLDYGSYSYRKVTDASGIKTISNVSMRTGIKDENWDYICFHQRVVLLPSYDDYFPYLPDLMEFAYENATNEEMEVAFHMPWSGRDGSGTWNCSQVQMYYLITDMIQQVMPEVGIEIVIPSGTAIQNARGTWMGNTFNRDTEHLEYNYGRYTAACAWFETFSGVDVTTTTYCPSTVTAAQKDVAVHAAHFAVQSPYEINPMTDWQVAP